MTADRWELWAGDLGATLADLADGHVLFLTAPPLPGGEVVATRPRALDELLRRRRVVDAPYLQCLRTGSVLVVELVGAASWGGHYPWSRGQDAALQELGWDRPRRAGDVGYVLDGESAPPWPPVERIAETVDLIVATLRSVCQVADPASLRLAVRRLPSTGD